MANITKIEFISDGFKAILQSEGTQQVVSEIADSIAAEANANGNCEGFESNTILGGRAQRYIGFAYASDKESMIAESENQALTRAVHS